MIVTLTVLAVLVVLAFATALVIQGVRVVHHSANEPPIRRY